MKFKDIKEKFNKFLDHIFVPDIKCIVCGKEIKRNERYGMCDKCLLSLPTIIHPCTKCGSECISGDVCLNCKTITPSFTNCYVVLKYSPPVTALIHKAKYKNAKYLFKYLSNLMYDKYLELGLDIDMLIPVPLNENRIKERGYNQSLLLCETFIKYGVHIDNDVLIRTKDTPHQTSLTREQRLTNLDKAFKVVDKSKIKGKTILILDDVYTTGSTLNEISKTLIKAGASKVYGLVLAHGDIYLPME